MATGSFPERRQERPATLEIDHRARRLDQPLARRPDCEKGPQEPDIVRVELEENF